MKHLTLTISLIVFSLLVGCSDTNTSELKQAESLIEKKDYKSAEYLCDGLSEKDQSTLTLEQKCALTAYYYQIFQGYLSEGEAGKISTELAEASGMLVLKKIYDCYNVTMKDDPIKAKEYYNTKWQGVDDKSLQTWTNIYILKK